MSKKQGYFFFLTLLLDDLLVLIGLIFEITGRIVPFAVNLVESAYLDFEALEGILGLYSLSFFFQRTSIDFEVLLELSSSIVFNTESLIIH